MNGFELQAWHVITFFILLILHLIKKEIAETVHAFLFMLEYSDCKDGEHFQIQTKPGEWDDVYFVRFFPPLPFGKVAGGVVIRHETQEGHLYEEKISFTTWRTMRIRKLV